MGRPIAKVYPNGEFSLWYETQSLDISDAPEADPLGLSTLPNSHKALLGLEEPKPRSPQGGNGISSYGALMVRNACYLLQKTHGRETLSFVTLTLPPLPDNGVVAKADWAEITRQVVQTFKRQLKAAGLPGSIVGVTEIQMERQRAEGGLPLHLHLVFQGRRRFQKGWAIAPHEVDIIWLRACTNTDSRFLNCSFKSACRIERIQKDAAGYMGKYLSKGKAAVQQIVSACPEAAALMPSAWWICSNNLRQAIKTRVVYGEKPARKILAVGRDESWHFSYWRDIWIELGDNPKAIHAIVGKLSPAGFRQLHFNRGSTDVLSNDEIADTD